MKGRIMHLPDIDWNRLWRDNYVLKRTMARDPDFWDKRAPEFVRSAKSANYINQFMAIMKPQRNWRVLDIGSAAGTLAAPMSPFVKSITAVDPSAKMRALLEERCDREGIDNIRIVDGRWEDDWDAIDIGIHDVAVASRSLIVEDLKGTITKLQRYAAKRIYLSTLVGDGPRDRKIVEAVGREFIPGTDYIVLVNLLRQMEIFANLSFTRNDDQKSFSSVEDALNSLRWMLHDLTQDEEEKLRAHLTRTLVQVDGLLQLPYHRVVRWAVLWWEKDSGDHS